MNSNKIVKSILEILGDPQTKGGYTLHTDDIDVPVFLNKDFTTVYPEIILSPFFMREDFDVHNNYGSILTNYTYYEKGTSQIDIYAKTLSECNKILEEIQNRLYDFSNLEILHHIARKKDFEIENNIYKNIAYGCDGQLFKEIYHIEINGKKIDRVLKMNKLRDNTYFADQEALYIKTNEDFEKVDITVITQGRLYKNKDSLENRGIIYLQIDGMRYLSDLENNEVERISCDLYTVFGAKREREKLPTVDYIEKRLEEVDKYGKKIH